MAKWTKDVNGDLVNLDFAVRLVARATALGSYKLYAIMSASMEFQLAGSWVSVAEAQVAAEALISSRRGREDDSDDEDEDWEDDEESEENEDEGDWSDSESDDEEDDEEESSGRGGRSRGRWGR